MEYGRTVHCSDAVPTARQVDIAHNVNVSRPTFLLQPVTHKRKCPAERINQNRAHDWTPSNNSMTTSMGNDKRKLRRYDTCKPNKM